MKQKLVNLTQSKIDAMKQEVLRTGKQPQFDDVWSPLWFMLDPILNF